VSLSGVVARHRGPVLVAVVVVGIAAVTFFTIRSGTGAKTAPTAPTAPTKASSGATAELVRLVDRGKSTNAEVAYTGSGANVAFTAHLWRRSPLGRLDTETGTAGTPNRSTQLVTSSGSFACTRAGDAPWSCAPKAGLGIADVGVVSPALVSKLSALDVSVRNDDIGGQAVRCFTVAAPPTSTPTTAPPAGASDLTSAEVCLTSDGIAVRVDAGSAHLEATSINRGRPPDSVFTLPTSP